MLFSIINLFRRSYSVSFPTRHIYILFLVAHILLVWIISYFPTQDGPSHIYNLAILHDLLNGGKEWGEYFTYNLKIVPNLGFNLLSYPLLFVVAPITAEKIFLSLYIFLMGIAVPLQISTFAPHASYSRMIKFLVIPVIFNFTLMMGFYSYAVGVPVFLIAISMAWRIRKRPILLRIICYNSVGILVYLLHLIPFIFYLLALAIFAVVEHERIGKATLSLVRQIASILPLVSMLIFYLLNGTSSPVPRDFSYLLSSFRAEYLLAKLFTFSTYSFSVWQLLP